MTDNAILTGPKSYPDGKPTSMVILLHGYGSNGDDLMGLVPAFRPHLPNTVFLAPNAPEKCPGVPGGYQWFPLATLSQEERDTGSRAAAPVLDTYLDAVLKEYDMPASKCVLLGFSQGTMLALHVGLRRAETLAGILGYSGALSLTGHLVAEGASKPPVQLVHGDSDNVVPAYLMFEAVGALMAYGVDVKKHISPGTAHGIAPDGVEVGVNFLKTILKP